MHISIGVLHTRARIRNLPSSVDNIAHSFDEIFKYDKILLQEMHPFFLKLNSILETFVDKSRPGKYCRNVYKSDYHDDVDILTCEDIHVNDTFTACSVDVIFLFHANLQYYHSYNK